MEVRTYRFPPAPWRRRIVAGTTLVGVAVLLSWWPATHVWTPWRSFVDVLGILSAAVLPITVLVWREAVRRDRTQIVLSDVGIASKQGRKSVHLSWDTVARMRRKSSRVLELSDALGSRVVRVPVEIIDEEGMRFALDRIEAAAAARVESADGDSPTSFELTQPLIVGATHIVVTAIAAFWNVALFLIALPVTAFMLWRLGGR